MIMQDFTSFTSKYDSSKTMNKSEIFEMLKSKLEHLLSEKIYLLNTNIEFLDDWMFSAIQSDDKKVRRTVKWYHSMHIAELDDTVLGFIKEIGKENIEENGLNKEFGRLIREKDKYKNDVVQIYKMVLDRYPDNSELLHYSNMLKYDIIDTERIEEILKNSDDYKIIENKRKSSDKINIGEIPIPKATRDDIDIDDYKDDHYTNIINKAYEEILQRNVGDNGLYVDNDGLRTYLYLMKNGMTEERLRNVLRSSQEYKTNFGIYQPETEAETKQTKPETVHVSDKKRKESRTITGISSSSRTDSDQLRLRAVSQLKLVYCMMGTNRLGEIKPYIETVLPYVDKFIFIDGGSEDGTVKYLKSLNVMSLKDVPLGKQKEDIVEVYVHPWQDRFSAQRNNYLTKLKERNYNGWVIISDTDEHFSVESLKQIRELIPELEAKGYSGIQSQVIDTTVDDDDFNRIIDSKKNEYWKALIFKYDPNLRYEGEPHETLVGMPIRWFKSTNDNIFYEHRRSKLHILKRATENYFISNSNRYSERWAEFRYVCTTNGILNFKEYWKLFEKHELPKDIEEWIRTHKDDNFDNGDSELREMALLYFEILPKRKKDKYVKTELELEQTTTNDSKVFETTSAINKAGFVFDDKEKKKEKVTTKFGNDFDDTINDMMKETFLRNFKEFLDSDVFKFVSNNIFEEKLREFLANIKIEKSKKN